MDNIDILGRMGEKLVANYLRRRGHMVEEAIDHFDSIKDMTVDGHNAEVKTQQAFVNENAFSIRENQLRKCRQVDELYIVSVPPAMRPDYKWAGWIFKVDPKTFRTRNYRTRQGIQMVLIDIDQPAVIPWAKLTDQENEQLSRYASSRY